MVHLRGPWGDARFSVEIAETPQERGRGLMFREEMARSAGMFFVYDAPQSLTFWMKNTLLPLDIIFVDAQGVVQHVHEHARPHDLTPIHGGDNLQYVLEINAGLSSLFGISDGTEVKHPAIHQETAAWPCAN